MWDRVYLGLPIGSVLFPIPHQINCHKEELLEIQLNFNPAVNPDYIVFFIYLCRLISLV